MSKEVSIVTGATKGIGKAIAYRLAEDGQTLSLFGREKKELDKVSSELKSKGTDVITFAGDVRDVEFVNKSIKTTIEKLGHVDNLINNAGIMIMKNLRDTTLEDFIKVMDTNVFGVYNFTRGVIEHMVERKRGTVINISSLAGLNGFAAGSLYAASKHAVMGFTRSLMLEYRKDGIRFAAVCPGSVATDMVKDFHTKPGSLEKILQPKDVADVVSSILKLPANALVSEVEIRPANPT